MRFRLHFRNLLHALAVLLAATAAQADEQSRTLAVVFGQGKQAPPPVVEALLTDVVGQLPGVALVEREQIGRVLAEQKLTALGVVDSAQAARLGQLLSADAFVLAEQETIGDKPVCRIRMTETRTGARLLDCCVTPEELADTPDAFRQELQRAADRLRTPAGKRRYVGVAGIHSDEPGPALDSLAQAMTALLEQDLGRLPAVVVLEREQLDRLAAERDLTGAELELRAATVLVEGGIRHDGDGSRLAMTLALRPLAGGTPQEVRLSLPSAGIESTRPKIREKLATALETVPAEGRAAAPHAEADVLRQRAGLLAGHQRYDEAARLIEAVLVLDPQPADAETARAYYWGIIRQEQVRRHTQATLLRAAWRIHTIDLAQLRELEKRDPALRTYDISRTVFPPFTLAKAPETDEERDLLRRVDEVRFGKLASVLEVRKQHKGEIVPLLLVRLQFAAYISESPDAFAALVKALHADLDAEAAAGRFDPLQEHRLYFYAMWTAQYQATRPSRSWKATALAPLWKELARHEQLYVRAFGYAGLLADDGDAGAQAARQLLDLLVDPSLRPEAARQLFSAQIALGPAAAKRLHAAGKLKSWLEGRLRLLEEPGGVQLLLNAPESAALFRFYPVEEADARLWCGRIASLLDAATIDEKDATAEKRIRELIGIPAAAPAPGPAGPLEAVPLRLANRDVRHKAILRGGLDRGAAGDGSDDALLLYWYGPNQTPEQRQNGQLCIVSRLDPGNGEMRDIAEFRSGEIVPDGRPFAVRSIAVNGETAFLGTSDRGLVVATRKGAKSYDQSAGCPSSTVDAVACLDGRVYLTGGLSPDYASLSAASLAVFDPQTEKFSLLASSSAVGARHALDGGKRYRITGLTADPKRGCLWFAVSGTRQAEGVWTFNPESVTFERVWTGTPVEGGLAWVGDRLLFQDRPSQQFLELDPDTRKCTKRPGYVAFRLYLAPIGQPRRTIQQPEFALLDDYLIGTSGEFYTPDGKKHLIAGREWEWTFLARYGSAVAAIRQRRAGRKDDDVDLWLVRPRTKSSVPPE